MLYLNCLLGRCLGSYPDLGVCTSLVDVLWGSVPYIVLEVWMSMVPCWVMPVGMSLLMYLIIFMCIRLGLILGYQHGLGDQGGWRWLWLGYWLFVVYHYIFIWSAQKFLGKKKFWHVINDKWWGQGRGNTGGYICFPQFIHNTGVYSSGSAGIGVLWVLVRLRRYPYLSLCPPVALGLYRSPLLSPLPRCLGWHILHFRSFGNTGRVYKFHIVPV